MTKQLELDITARKHGGNPQSAAAHRKRAHKGPQQRERVLAAIRLAGEQGLTCDELAERWGVGMNAVSGRFSELSRAGKITKNGTRPTRTGNRAGAWVEKNG